MNKYFKKFSIMFVMLLAIIGAGMIQNGSVANASTKGDQLTQAESGWQRIDDTDKKILYNGNWSSGTDSNWYNNTWHQSGKTASAQFEFYGSKIRMIGPIAPSRCNNVKMVIDGDEYNYSEYNSTIVRYVILQENLKLNLGIHDVKIYTQDEGAIGIDSIDIDDTGYLVEPSLKLDNSILTLPVGTSEQLTATTTPAAVGVTWKTSDPLIATVDSTGKVTAIKEGTCTITATSMATLGDGSYLNATCAVTVTPKGTAPEPTKPSEPSGDENLYIQLVNGDIKKYTVTNDEFEKFKHWYQDRVDNKAGTPFYQFDKDGHHDYVVNDKIEWFELR